MDFRGKINSLYPEVFDESGEATEVERQTAKKWKWFGAVYSMAENVTKVDEIMNLKYGLVMNWLAYSHDYAKVVDARVKANSKKNRI